MAAYVVEFRVQTTADRSAAGLKCLRNPLSLPLLRETEAAVDSSSQQENTCHYAYTLRYNVVYHY